MAKVLKKYDADLALSNLQDGFKRIENKEQEDTAVAEPANIVMRLRKWVAAKIDKLLDLS